MAHPFARRRTDPLAGLEVNDLVAVELGEQSYPSRVEERWEDELALVMPMARGRLVIPAPGQRTRLRFTRAGMGLVLLDTRVRRHEFGVVPLFVAGAGEPPRVIERRRHYRLPAALAVALWTEEVLRDGRLPVLARTLDVSAGGMRLLAPPLRGEASFALLLDGQAPAAPGARSSVLALPGGPKVILGHARVLAPLGPPPACGGPREQRLQYTRLQPADQDYLIRYIFERQRARLRHDMA